ncbi:MULTISPECIES: helix-turn-helix domain-containing protein [Streptomyces]|uniref:helix-turn-helix domain-containing protein n=1 Tax=Streptomyces TaxID=1883 RepID=UPI0019631546|nr:MULTISPECIES: helix-turn-helix transcriptional regulator [Streptomyces]QRX94349.1 helix-turn-helix transcriptional regulator [Streptomyces noursei]UJB44059.1 helix-turn-helix transcriptional regulator [Streptomyces sp. A1-5]
MPVNTHDGDAVRPPFNAAAARRLREALGMTHAHVAYGIWAAYGIRLEPAAVASWELGEGAPTEAELTALAGALWCAPAELLGAPRTLREFRLTLGLAPADLALRIGMDQAAYERLEAGGRWTGTDRQAATLAAELRLPLPALIRFTGQQARLVELLTSAATTRWQGYVRPVGKLAPLPKERLQQALQELHEEYHARMTASLSWTGGDAPGEAGRAGREFLDDIAAEFWRRVGEAAP